MALFADFVDSPSTYFFNEDEDFLTQAPVDLKKSHRKRAVR
jgi:hypothetical protein